MSPFLIIALLWLGSAVLVLVAGLRISSRLASDRDPDVPKIERGDAPPEKVIDRKAA